MFMGVAQSSLLVLGTSCLVGVQVLAALVLLGIVAVMYELYCRLSGNGHHAGGFHGFHHMMPHHAAAERSAHLPDSYDLHDHDAAMAHPEYGHPHLGGHHGMPSWLHSIHIMPHHHAAGERPVDPKAKSQAGGVAPLPVETLRGKRRAHPDLADKHAHHHAGLSGFIKVGWR